MNMIATTLPSPEEAFLAKTSSQELSPFIQTNLETQEIAMKATNALWDREDGKPTNKNEHAGLNGEPLQPFQINVHGVEAEEK